MAVKRNNKGFSLVELMVVIAIVGIMGTFAVPPMISWLQNKGLQSAARDLYSNMRKAQSVAVKNNRNCAISFYKDGTGYLVYVDEKIDGTKKYSHQADEQIIADVRWSQYRNVYLDDISFTYKNIEDQITFAFRPNLIPSHDGIVKLENSTSRNLGVEVSPSGSISLQ